MEPLPMNPNDDKAEELRKYCLERAELITEGLTVEALIRIADKLYQYVVSGEVKEKTP